MSSTTHRLPGVDFTSLSLRRRLDAVAHIQQARRQADAESSRTIRERNLDAAVKPHPPSTSSPRVLTSAMPPSLLVAALLAAFVLVGGLLSIASSQRLRNAADGGVVAGSSAEWRDGVEQVP